MAAHSIQPYIEAIETSVAAGLTLAYLGVQVGVTNRTIGNWRRGSGSPWRHKDALATLQACAAVAPAVELPELIDSLRRKGWTVREIARGCGYKSQSVVYQWYNGEHFPIDPFAVLEQLRQYDAAPSPFEREHNIRDMLEAIIDDTGIPIEYVADALRITTNQIHHWRSGRGRPANMQRVYELLHAMECTIAGLGEQGDGREML